MSDAWQEDTSSQGQGSERCSQDWRKFDKVKIEEDSLDNAKSAYYDGKVVRTVIR